MKNTFTSLPPRDRWKRAWRWARKNKWTRTGSSYEGRAGQCLRDRNFGDAMGGLEDLTTQG